MKLKMYSLLDRKAETFQQPMFFQNEAVAIRAFESGVNSPEQMISQWAEDYTLWWIGDFNMETGFFEAADTPTRVARAQDFVKSPEERANGRLADMAQLQEMLAPQEDAK